MSGELFILRPQPGADVTAGKAQKAGFTVYVAPLFDVVPVSWRAQKAEKYDAILFGSANALRHAGARLEQYCGLPAYAVGAVTAEEASLHGFNVVKQGRGGIKDIWPDLLESGHKQVLRLTGQDHIKAEIAGLMIDTKIVYDAQATPLDGEVSLELARNLNEKRLGGKPVILLHSARAVRHFTTLIDTHKIARSTIKIAAFGKAIKQAAGLGWADVAYAEEYSDEALLAVAAILCKKV